MLNIVNVIIAAVAAVLGFALGPLNCKILNKIPAAWLCDYDEEPSQELLSGNRYKLKPTGYIMGGLLSIFMAAASLLIGVSPALVFVIVLIELLMLISASDAKYTIIPDQFTVAVAVVSLIFAAVDLFTGQAFIDKWYQPFLGALCGAGILMLLDFLSLLIFKRTGFGFGDVKLLAALGLLFGFKYILVTLVISFMAAAIHFLVLIFTGKARKGVYLPLGPHICLAAVVTILFQSQIIYLFDLYKALMSMAVLP